MQVMTLFTVVVTEINKSDYNVRPRANMYFIFQKKKKRFLSPSNIYGVQVHLRLPFTSDTKSSVVHDWRCVLVLFSIS